MEGATRSNMSYLDKLAKFHRQQGTTLSRLPSLDKQPIDLYQLKRAVDARGGFKEVCNTKRWAEIGRELGYAKNLSSVSTGLKNAYQKYLLPYETYLEKAKPEFLREMGLAQSPQEGKNETKSPSGMRRNLLEQIQNAENEMEYDEENATPSPQNGLKRTIDETTASSSTENDKEEPVRRESKRLKKGMATKNSY
jgi:histone demethylase JARID1